MTTLLQDLRYGFRMLVKTPGFTAIAALTLGLGIGANSTIFSWINSTLLDPIPGVRNTGNLVSLMRGERKESPLPPFSFLDYADMRDRNQSFAGLLAYHDSWMALTGAGKPERVFGTMASANYFDVLGVRPTLGRGFLPEEEQKPGGAPVVVISTSLWQSRYGADPSIIGKTIEINRHGYTIVGVAPADFQGCKTGLHSALWLPLVMDPVVTGWGRILRRETCWLQLIGRLKPGVDQRKAQAEMNLLMQQIVEQHPDSHTGSNEITIDPLWRSPFGASAFLYARLPMLMAIAGVVLLLACANVANLLLIRSVARRREIAIRLSIGASRWQMVRQLLAESLLLALSGGGIATLITALSVRKGADFFLPANIQLAFNIRLDRTVLLATIGISIFTAILFGILPALRAARMAPAAALKEEAGSVSAGLHKSRLASALVVAQISLSMLLLICAGLFIRGVRAAQRINPGFDQNQVLLASIDLLASGYAAADGIEFERELIARLEAVPGVESVTLANFVPLGSGHHSQTILPEGYVPRLHESMEVRRVNVGPNYFRTMRIPLVAGRDFTPLDTGQTQLVVIVNQALAARYWPGQDPLGRRLYTKDKWFTVVGVARNCNYRRLNETPQPAIFLPLFQDFYHEAVIHVRVSGDPRAFASVVEKTVHGLNADLPVFNVTTLKSQAEIATTFERIAGRLVSAFGVLALVLAAVGIYAVIAYTTRQRTREIGIRVALGARRGAVFWLVLRQGFQMTLIGLAVGLAASLGLTRFLRGLLVGVTPTDTLTYASVSVLLCFVALVACYIPARRAAMVDPITALHYE